MRFALHSPLLALSLLGVAAAAHADTFSDFAITDGGGNVFTFALSSSPNGYVNSYPATAYYDGGSQPIPVYENGQLLTYEPVNQNGAALTSYPYSTGVNNLQIAYGPNEEFYDPYLIELTFAQPIATIAPYTGSTDDLVTFFPGTYAAVYGPDVLTITADSAAVATTPEPSSWLLLASGLAALVIFGRRRAGCLQP